MRIRKEGQKGYVDYQGGVQGYCKGVGVGEGYVACIIKVQRFGIRVTGAKQFIIYFIVERVGHVEEQRVDINFVNKEES